MKKAVFCALLAVAIAVAGAAPASAETVRHKRVLTSGQSGNTAHKTVSRAKKSRQSRSPVQNNAVQDDNYTTAREQMIKSAM